jgi:hypothetical protein
VKLSLYGSVLRDDFQMNSDIDILVEFAPGKAPGLIRYSRMERELSEILGNNDLKRPCLQLDSVPQGDYYVQEGRSAQRREKQYPYNQPLR